MSSQKHHSSGGYKEVDDFLQEGLPKSSQPSKRDKTESMNTPSPSTKPREKRFRAISSLMKSPAQRVLGSIDTQPMKSISRGASKYDGLFDSLPCRLNFSEQSPSSDVQTSPPPEYQSGVDALVNAYSKSSSETEDEENDETDVPAQALQDSLEHLPLEYSLAEGEPFTLEDDIFKPARVGNLSKDSDDGYIPPANTKETPENYTSTADALEQLIEMSPVRRVNRHLLDGSQLLKKSTSEPSNSIKISHVLPCESSQTDVQKVRKSSGLNAKNSLASKHSIIEKTKVSSERFSQKSQVKGKRTESGLLGNREETNMPKETPQNDHQDLKNPERSRGKNQNAQVPVISEDITAEQNQNVDLNALKVSRKDLLNVRPVPNKEGTKKGNQTSENSQKVGKKKMNHQDVNALAQSEIEESVYKHTYKSSQKLRIRDENTQGQDPNKVISNDQSHSHRKSTNIQTSQNLIRKEKDTLNKNTLLEPSMKKSCSSSHGKKVSMGKNLRTVGKEKNVGNKVQSMVIERNKSLPCTFEKKQQEGHEVQGVTSKSVQMHEPDFLTNRTESRDSRPSNSGKCFIKAGYSSDLLSKDEVLPKGKRKEKGKKIQAISESLPSPKGCTSNSEGFGSGKHRVNKKTSLSTEITLSLREPEKHTTGEGRTLSSTAVRKCNMKEKSQVHNHSTLPSVVQDRDGKGEDEDALADLTPLSPYVSHAPHECQGAESQTCYGMGHLDGFRQLGHKDLTAGLQPENSNLDVLDSHLSHKKEERRKKAEAKRVYRARRRKEQANNDLAENSRRKHGKEAEVRENVKYDLVTCSDGKPIQRSYLHVSSRIRELVYLLIPCYMLWDELRSSSQIQHLYQRLVAEFKEPASGKPLDKAWVMEKVKNLMRVWRCRVRAEVKKNPQKRPDNCDRISYEKFVEELNLPEDHWWVEARKKKALAAQIRLSNQKSPSHRFGYGGSSHFKESYAMAHDGKMPSPDETTQVQKDRLGKTPCAEKTSRSAKNIEESHKLEHISLDTDEDSSDTSKSQGAFDKAFHSDSNQNLESSDHDKSGSQSGSDGLNQSDSDE